MAHFAELDSNNTVLRVIVVSNDHITDVNGVEDENLGIAFCKRLYGVDTEWKQTSYNATFRSHYAGIGYKYREDLDAFVPQQPYASWTLNESNCEWEPPTPLPELTVEDRNQGVIYDWNEATLQWDKTVTFPANGV